MSGKRIISLFVAVIILVALFAGCGTGNTDTGAATASTQEAPASSAAATTQENLGTKIVKDPLTLTFHYFWDPGFLFKDDLPVWVEAARQTNITLKGTVPSTATDGDTAFATMMASGELSDIVQAASSNLSKYGTEGAFIRLNELLEQYAPNFMAFLEKRPDIKSDITDFSTPDKNIYFVPYVPDGIAKMGWFIRQDWLDKLGLSIPKTSDELYNVLIAFRDRDPNGNGKKDEIPFFDRNWNDVLDVPAVLEGVKMDYYADENGKIQNGMYLQKTKNAFALAAKWYKESITDREMFTRGDSRNEFLGEKNVGGFTHDWFASTAMKNDQLKDVNPGLNFVVMAPPAGVDGKIREATARETSSTIGWAISKTNKHPIETIKYFDYFFTEAGRRLMNYGIEGINYTMKDGKPVFTDDMLHNKDGKATNQLLWEVGAQYQTGYQQDYDYELQWMNPIAKAGVEMYINSNYIMPLLPLSSMHANELEKRILEEKGPAVNKYIEEAYQKFVTGTWTVDKDFDKYMNDMKNLGMEDMLAARQSQYDRYLIQK